LTAAHRLAEKLPLIINRGALIYPNKEREQAAYEYVNQDGETVRSLRGADFFVETCIVCNCSSFG
jgi:hypothetical protein